MTVLIRGMDMPREGASLFIEVNSTGHIICQYSDDIVHYGYKNKAVPVPTPHGRMIDADELYKKINVLRIDAIMKSKDANQYWEFLDAIIQAPTVIEAEK